MAYHLLLTAHDTAAARSIAEVVRAIRREPTVCATVLADGPAVGVLREQGVAAEAVPVPRVAAGDESGLDALFRIGEDQLARLRPDAVIAGLSGPDAGLDEAIIDAAFGRVPRFAVQDFWGDVNPVGRTAPDVYFVGDERAADLTRQRSSAQTVVVGLPRYAALQAPPNRESARRALGLAPSDIALCWFGQPLAHVSGYHEILETFGRAAAALKGNVQLFYRPHPREESNARATASATLSAGACKAMPADEFGLETLLSGLDVAASAFSTVAVDLVYLQRLSPEPLATGLYCTNREVDDYLYHYGGVRRVPLVDEKMALAIRADTTLTNRLAEAALTRTRRQMHAAAGRVRDPARAADTLVSEVMRRLNRERVEA